LKIRRERGCGTFGAIGSGSHLIGKSKKIGGKFSETFCLFFSFSKEVEQEFCLARTKLPWEGELLSRTTPFAGLKRFVLGLFLFSFFSR
jgi:hypothetical protein